MNLKTPSYRMVGQDASTKLVDNTTHASASRRAKHSLRIRRKVAYPNAVKKDGVCKYYKAYKTIRTAWGFRKIMENIKVTDANAIRQELRLFFGNNSRYYRYFNGKRRLTEKQKVWIEKLFESYGYADIQFDRNLEEVDI